MMYKGDIDQKAALVEALKELRVKKRSFPELANDISSYAKQNVSLRSISTKISEAGITRTTLENYMRRNPNKQWDYEYPFAIYTFLSKSEKYQTNAIKNIMDRQQSAHPRVMEIISEYFLTKDTIRYNLLYCLEGQYAMFRRLWSSPSDIHFIRSIVTIGREGKWLTYREIQDYVDPISTSPVIEIDSGYLFVFDRNCFILAREENDKSIKFLVIHDYFPYINDKAKVDIFAGNLIGVAGSGPHPGYRFICRRIKEENGFESRVLTIDELDITCSKYFASDGKIHF